jgi:hypothetical protein
MLRAPATEIFGAWKVMWSTHDRGRHQLEAGARLVMSTDEGAFPMETTYTWQDTPNGGNHMTLRNRGEPSGFVNLAAPLMSAQMRRSTSRDLRLLKSILERRHVE